MSEVETLDAEAQEAEVQENPLADLVDAALAKDYNKANEIFGQAVSVKLDDVMDQERIKLAGQIFNGEEEEDVEDPDDSEDDSEVEDTEAEDDVDDAEDDDEENSSEQKIIKL